MATTLIPVYDPIALVVQSTTGAAYDLYTVNVVTGVVTSTILSTAAVALLQERAQKLLPLLPGLSSTALQSLVRNLVGLNQLEGTFTATVTPVGNDYTLGVSGLAVPSNMQVALPFSEVSPFADDGSNSNGSSGGGGGVTTIGTINTGIGGVASDGAVINGATLFMQSPGLGNGSRTGLVSSNQVGALAALGSLNFIDSSPFTVDTTNATPTLITIPIGSVITEGGTLTIEATIAASESTGGGNNAAGYKRSATFQVRSGVMTQVGATADVWTQETDPAWDVTLITDGSNVGNGISAQVTGVAATNITWGVQARVSVQVFPT